jgi:3-keto-L-gulonate-6-phosphate decarboxylase
MHLLCLHTVYDLPGGLGGPETIVQVSIDVTDVEHAIAVGEMAMRAGADWLEYGTPLVVFEGLRAMRGFAAAFPDVPIFCDAKIVDGARKYVVEAADQGARFVSVCGIATDATLRAAVAGASDTGTTVAVDLYAAHDPVSRAREVEAFGAGLVYLHYGGDQRADDAAGDVTLELIPRVRRAVSVPVGAVTFDADGAAAAVRQGADIVVIGHPFLTGPDAERMLTDYVMRVRAASRDQHATVPASD